MAFLAFCTVPTHLQCCNTTIAGQDISTDTCCNSKYRTLQPEARAWQVNLSLEGRNSNPPSTQPRTCLPSVGINDFNVQAHKVILPYTILEVVLGKADYRKSHTVIICWGATNHNGFGVRRSSKLHCVSQHDSEHVPNFRNVLLGYLLKGQRGKESVQLLEKLGTTLARQAIAIKPTPSKSSVWKFASGSNSCP